MKYLIIILALIISSCGKKSHEKADEIDKKDTTTAKYQIIEEDVLSNWDENDNIDSPAFYQGPNGENWIIATAKSTDRLFVYDAATGEVIKTVSEEGTELGQMDRPNGIWVINDYCFVVERDNHRIQVFKLPEFKSLGFIGESELMKPYGLSVVNLADHPKASKAGFNKNQYMLFVTDNYEYEEDKIPADSLLDKRLAKVLFEINDDKIENVDFSYISATFDKDALLKVVESVLVDLDNRLLYVCEELEGAGNTCIKIFDFDGVYKRTLGKDLFQSQAEGLAIINCGDGEGYLVTTDQSYDANIFHFFDRKTLELKGSFQPSKVSNTDGIWLSQKSFGEFTKGQFIAVNNDGGVGAWNLEKLMEKLDLTCD